MIKDFMIAGTLSIFVYSDFIICLLLLNGYLLTKGSVSLGAANSFANIFVQITCFALGQGLNMTLQIYTTQCLAKKEFRKMNVYLR